MQDTDRPADATAPDVEIRRITHGAAAYEAAVALRNRLLRRPLGLFLTPEQLNSEDRCVHVGAFDRDKLVGCLLLAPLDATRIQMRQVAVEPAHQGAGIGTRMVQFAEQTARKDGFELMVLNARLTAVRFYSRLGYRTTGEEFIEVSIPHIRMEKVLRA